MDRFMRTEMVTEALVVLNRLHRADPSVLNKLVYMRVPCNEKVANDKDVQVGFINNDPEAGCEVGLLGIINGLFGTDAAGHGFIIADVADNGTILGFHPYYTL